METPPILGEGKISELGPRTQMVQQKTTPNASVSDKRMESHGSAWAAVSRWSWVIVLAALVGGAVGLFFAVSSPSMYQSESVVISLETADADVAGFGPLAETIFSTDVVLQPVIDELELNTTPQQLLSQDHLSAQAVTDTAAIRILGQSSDQNTAVKLANIAAESLMEVSERKGLGRLAMYEAFEGRPTRTSLAPAIGSALAGHIAGGLLGLGLVLLGTLIRQPLLSVSHASREFPADAAFEASLVKSRVKSARSKDLRYEIRPRGLSAAVWRICGDGTASQGRSTCYVLVGNSRRKQELEILVSKLGRSQGDTAGSYPGRTNPKIVAATDRLLPDALADAEIVFALVAYGSPAFQLRAVNDELRVLPGRRTRILITAK